MQTRRERVREATREEIKATTRQYIAEHGAPALSLRAIATEMGMTAPALYRYFKNRDDLVTALIVDAYAAMAETIRKRRDEYAQVGHAARFLSGCAGYREWAVAHPQDYNLLFGTPIPGYVGPEEIIVPIAARSLRLMVEIVDEALRAGKMQPPTPYSDPPPALQAQIAELAQRHGYPPQAFYVSVIVWSRMHGLVSLEVVGQIQPLVGDPAEIFQQELRLMLEQYGLRD